MIRVRKATYWPADQSCRKIADRVERGLSDEPNPVSVTFLFW